MTRIPLILALHTDDLFANAKTQSLGACASQHQDASPAPRRRCKGRGSWLRMVLLIFLVPSVLVLLLGYLYLNTLPNVGDAEIQVARILRLHHGKEVNGLLTTKVGQAIIAVEDERFLQHHGIDSVGLLRAAWSTLTGQGVEGGSTITEQLAKALYIPDDHTLRTKIPMMGVAIKLEQHYSKAQILDMYLNSIYFGDQQWGIAQASHAFFDKAPQALTWGEASLIAGLPQAPSSYDPTRHWALARLRQRHVLDRMVVTGVLSRAQAIAAYQATRLHLGKPNGGQTGKSAIRRVTWSSVCGTACLWISTTRPLHRCFILPCYITDGTHEAGALKCFSRKHGQGWKPNRKKVFDAGDEDQFPTFRLPSLTPMTLPGNDQQETPPVPAPLRPIYLERLPYVERASSGRTKDDVVKRI